MVVVYRERRWNREEGDETVGKGRGKRVSVLRDGEIDDVALEIGRVMKSGSHLCCGVARQLVNAYCEES